MKKLLSIIISICLLVNVFPLFAFAVPTTPEISLEEFASQLKGLQEQYDDNYVSELVFEDGSDFYHVDGEAFPLENDEGEPLTASVSESGIDIPLSILTDSSVEVTEKDITEAEIKTFQKTRQTKNTQSVEDYAATLGYDVDINDDTAVFTQPYQTHRLIVKSKYNIDPLDSVAIVEGYNDLHIVQFDDRESTLEALEYYNNQRKIEYVEPDLVLAISEYENVHESSASSSNLGINYGNHLSWGSEAVGVDDYIDYLGNVESLPEVVVGIIDSGIELDHEFLADRIVETGFNLSDSGTLNSESDDNGHGTHVAGIIVDNTTDNVKIKGYKVLNSNGTGTISNICLGIDQATADGVNIINMSLGGRGKSSLMEDAVNNAVSQGVIVCVSAGNSGGDAAKYTPACIDSCITVACLDEYGNVPFWSNWGNPVDIIAPGVYINSSYLENTYKELSGTSMACPFVAAASALMLSRDMSLSREDIINFFEESGKECNVHAYLKGRLALYIGNISSLNLLQERTLTPILSVPGGKYSDSVVLEISCPEEADIYYTLDGSRVNPLNGIHYEGPITIDKVTRVHAIAVAENKLKSLQVVADYYITTTDPDGNFEIDTNGIVTKYNGTNNYLTIPDTINGITVTGIGEKAFYQSSIVLLKCPDSLTQIGKRAFYACPSLYAVYSENITSVSDYAFWYCQKLTIFDFSQLETVGDYAFWSCFSLTELSCPKLTVVGKQSFKALKNAIYINMPNVKRIEKGGLSGAYRAQTINIPNVEYMASGALGSCYAVQYLDLPKLTALDPEGSQLSFSKSLIELSLENYEGVLPQDILSNSGVQIVKLNKAVGIETEALEHTSSLNVLFMPRALTMSENAFGTGLSKTSNDLELIFAPNLKKMCSLPNTTCELKIYCMGLDNFSSDEQDGDNFTVISPSGSKASIWAIENNYNTIDSFSLIDALGENIRAYDNGLRFNYSWDEIEELNECAESVSYGFEYSYDGYAHNVEADNRVFNIDTGAYSFSLILNNIPNDKKDTQINANAVINIDGMVFKSPQTACSFNTETNTTDSFIIGDVDDSGIVDLCDYMILKSHISGLLDLDAGEYALNNADNMFDFITGAFSDKTVEFLAGDINADGAVDAFDLFQIDKMINA